MNVVACSASENTLGSVARKQKHTPTANDEVATDGEESASPGTMPVVDAGRGTPSADGAASVDAAKGIDSTKGSGGPTGFNELQSTGGLSYQLDAPAAAGPHGLLVLLHGSTASNYREFVPMMAQVAAAHDLIRVSVLAPNGKGWNEGQG